MNINRHNYEEFFILYLDNELSSEDRSMVEAFVQNHPDLKEELDTLFQFKLEPDTNIVFEGKEELMMMGSNIAINNNNYEEWLTLYIDNELTKDQKNAVDQFIKANPAVAAELALLQRTKLQPETIVFADKQSLYRREEKVRRIPVLWWRAVAAVLILALGLTTFFVLNKKPSAEKEQVATVTGNEEKNNTKEIPVLVKENNQPEQKIEEQKTPLQQVTNNAENVFAQQKNNTTESKKGNNGTVSKLKEIIPAPLKNDEDVLAENNNKPTNNLPQPINPNRTATADVASNNNKTIEVPTSLTNSKVTNTNTSPSDYTNASFDPNKNSDDVLDQSTGKKSKLRGFFRKVTRTFEKRTNIDPTDDEERLLVGGLAIRLK